MGRPHTGRGTRGGGSGRHFVRGGGGKETESGTETKTQVREGTGPRRESGRREQWEVPGWTILVDCPLSTSGRVLEMEDGRWGRSLQED